MAPGKPKLSTAPPVSNPGHASNVTSAPLADYFFIAGIESAQVYDEKAANAAPPPGPVGDTIDEDKELETDGARLKSTVTNTSASTGARPNTPGSPTDTVRRSHYSFENRKSIGSIIFNGTDPATLAPSNRSSTTIRAPPNNDLHGLSDDAFEEALKKFTTERDSFLEDIHVAAGAVTTSQTQRRPRPKAVRITSEDDLNPNGSGGVAGGLKNGVGSLRRRLSTMNSMKRHSSVMSRASTRTSKRLSGYNSVIPAPQPFHTTPDMHPLKRQYEPVLLDRYPTRGMVDETKRRAPFPDYVPMFTFPNDVTVVSSDERPRSTWHGFAMTNQDNSRLHGICVIVWVPLNHSASEGLERQCEEWRRANMSDEERELASSLGERLSSERAKLSRLLAELPSMVSGSDARDRLEEEISAVEEKISLMTDLLRPVRHGAASKIDGLTEGDTGFWIPRAYGILGREGSLTSFWKEWLKAVVVPMTNGAILRVPPSSPRVGLWQPLERYVCNLCVEAMSPITSITQVEVSIRELHLYARKEALNELPGSRNTDLYALFRCLTLPNIITLFEYALAESRIILLSSHTAMLHLAANAILSLIYPLKWTGVFIPVLPARLIQALEAPCPYIAGVERRYEKLGPPDDDFCLVDLDENTIESTAPPTTLPRQQRRKLLSLLQTAAPHHLRFGVSQGPPPYVVETFPCDAFSSENAHIFNSTPAPATLATYVSESSTTFGDAARAPPSTPPVLNAFLQQRSDTARGNDRPSTSSTSTGNSHSSSASPPSPISPSPISNPFSGNSAAGSSRNDSGFALQASLREKRSGHFAERPERRNSTVHSVQSLLFSRNPGSSSSDHHPPSFEQQQQYMVRRPSASTLGHHSTLSTSTLANGYASSSYAPSVYAQSTIAASTILQQPALVVPVHDSDALKWAEGHCLRRRRADQRELCAVCDERCEEEAFQCSGCRITVHARCAPEITIVCPIAFRPDLVRAAFVRCFASLFYTYRRHMQPATGDAKRAGRLFTFSMDHFLKSAPNSADFAAYLAMLRETQAFNEFIHDREALPTSNPSIRLFDDILASKKLRGGRSRALPLHLARSASSSSGLGPTSYHPHHPHGYHATSPRSFLYDSSEHLWRSAAATTPASRFPGDIRLIAARVPARLDPTFMKEPRSIAGAARVQNAARTKRKPVASMMGVTAAAATGAANGDPGPAPLGSTSPPEGDVRF